MPAKGDSLALFLFTESNLHSGSGSTLSDIDLPIQREVHSLHPIVAASGVKGALRSLARGPDGELSGPFEAIFGPESGNASEHGGLALFSEARVALFPVAAADGVFRWVTCPMVLHRLARDLRARSFQFSPPAAAAAKAFSAIDIPAVDGWNAAASSPAGIYLRDYELTVVSDPAVAQLADWFADNALPADAVFWRDKLRSDLVLVSEAVFTHLVRFATHIDLHVKLDWKTGTVDNGPWAEESLPPDTLLWVSVDLPEALDGPIRRKLGSSLPPSLLRDLLNANSRFQLGGGRSLSMGWVAAREFAG